MGSNESDRVANFGTLRPPKILVSQGSIRSVKFKDNDKLDVPVGKSTVD